MRLLKAWSSTKKVKLLLLSSNLLSSSAVISREMDADEDSDDVNRNPLERPGLHAQAQGSKQTLHYITQVLAPFLFVLNLLMLGVGNEINAV